MAEDTFTRRDFLRVVAGAVAVGAAGAACGSGSNKSEPSGSAAKGNSPKSGRTLRIAQWNHYAPDYDSWFDAEYTEQWGAEHDVKVVVDHLFFNDLPPRASAEVAAQRGHDIFSFVSPPPIFEDDVIDHREIVEEVEAKRGKLTPLCERSIFNPKTGKYFAFADYWAANLVHYRVDLWEEVEPGLRPGIWDDVLKAAPKLKGVGHPVGIGISPDVDSNYSLFSFLHAYGASVQDEGANVAINRPATVEAVKAMAALYQSGMSDQVFAWDGGSNNRLLITGEGSLILNAVSAIRVAERQDPKLAENIILAPVPTAGPGIDPVRGVYFMGANVIWKFSPNQDLAKQFLVDLALQGRETFVRSGFYNLPALPGTVPDLAELVANDATANPRGKYALLADAEKWSTNIGHPSHANAAVDEVFNQYLVPRMFAAAARNEMTAEDAVRKAEAEMKPIFEKWRDQDKI